jgi:hypothetical protein
MSKFHIGQKVKVKATGQIKIVQWISFMSRTIYRLENGFLYEEEELEAVNE